MLKTEQERVFEGPVWNFLCLELEVADPGDWRATKVGQMPVVVVRDTDGSIAAFENRCVHRGALICLDIPAAAASFVIGIETAEAPDQVSDVSDRARVLDRLARVFSVVRSGFQPGRSPPALESSVQERP